MKRKISWMLALVLLLSCFLVALSSCGERQVPVYRGMVWSNAGTNNSISVGHSNGGRLILSGGDADDESAGYGHYDGDYVGKDVTIDEESSVFDEDGLLGAIDLKILGKDFGGVGSLGNSGDKVHISNPSQNFEDIFALSSACLEVFLYNPDNYEIVSFTLNGEQYSGDMFESGSSMERITVKPKITTTSSGLTFIGISFKISDIKYRDGDEIKDVIMEGSDTIEASGGDPTPVATVSNMSLAGTTLSFDVNLSETSAKIVKGEMLAVIYNGKSIVASQDVFVGDNSVTFEGLRPNTLYQCAVGGYYYDGSSVDGQLEILYKYSFYTDPAVLFDNVTVGAESITFDFLWSEDQTEKEINLLNLYRDGVWVDVLDGSTTEILHLDAGTSYKLVAEYLWGGHIMNITLEFTTLAAGAVSEN